MEAGGPLAMFAADTYLPGCHQACWTCCKEGVDLHKGYHQIPMHRADKVVATSFGLLDFRGLPFGLWNAAAPFDGQNVVRTCMVFLVSG
jgi:hypothetical protein